MVHGSANQSQRSAGVWLTVIICGLGYFVDIYDLILFSIVRTESLKAIGVAAADIQGASELILNAQMIGFLIGGALFGVLADKKGRLSVLLASILLYSVMNIANAFVTSVPMYATFRFLSGIGLAGELGVAITLVSEIMPVRTRGFGTTVVASLGILGAVAAYLMHTWFSWQMAFIVGGAMGLALLVTRVRIKESAMFRSVETSSNVDRGNLLMIFTGGRLKSYLASVAIGLPVWYVIGILVTFSPEFSKASGSTDAVVGGTGVMWSYVGLCLGDIVSGLLSQVFRSRKRTIALFLVLTAASVTAYLTADAKSATTTYMLCGIMGFCVGYWAVFVTTAAEQFGTNLRATVATTVPNVVRGSLALAILGFGWLRTQMAADPNAMQKSAAIIGGVALLLAGLGWYALRETYGKDLAYVER